MKDRFETEAQGNSEMAYSSYYYFSEFGTSLRMFCCHVILPPGLSVFD